MKKILFSFFILLSLLKAEVINVTATPQFLESNPDIKVIDIRTPSEWRETGIIKNSYTLTFFDERGYYNIENFLNGLNKIVKRDEKFALICRTGSRTTMVSNFLGKKLHYNVVNLKGGIMSLVSRGYKLVPYKQ
ncbi:MAG: rhodanese-like domain-containing protein [Epsilonproteobacteria bacterium]|jgi:rhodanese-related sulfurtransferase|nr:rhodanese-like domain-containing protein [Campylobacterota bacterium]